MNFWLHSLSSAGPDSHLMFCLWLCSVVTQSGGNSLTAVLLVADTDWVFIPCGFFLSSCQKNIHNLNRVLVIITYPFMFTALMCCVYPSINTHTHTHTQNVYVKTWRMRMKVRCLELHLNYISDLMDFPFTPLCLLNTRNIHIENAEPNYTSRPEICVMDPFISFYSSQSLNGVAVSCLQH